ncbi:MAG: DUF4233 domain-containing protein [Actinomycetes bacterium]
MRLLGAAVLVMESMVMGFALLLAMNHHSSLVVGLGGALAFALFITAGLMKRKIGWYFGSVLQVGMIAYGLAVTAMYFMGMLFGFLWVCAYVIGKKGEAARAAFLANPRL